MNQRPAPGDLCLDHVGHFVPDLAAAAAVIDGLGLVATPESAHRTQHGPAGTSNRCVMLGEGYIEILAPTLDTENARRVRARMERFVGVHLCCFGTSAPQEEHARLAAHGFEPEPLIHLARTLPDGTPVRFNVVYVPPAKMPEGRIQYCEHLTEEAMWREGVVNRDLRLAAIYVVAEDPSGTAARWARFTGTLPRRSDGLTELVLARGRILIGTREAVAMHLGEAPPAPALAGYALRCRQPGEFAARCEESGMKVSRTSSFHAVRLPPSLGGVWLIM